MCKFELSRLQHSGNYVGLVDTCEQIHDLLDEQKNDNKKRKTSLQVSTHSSNAMGCEFEIVFA